VTITREIKDGIRRILNGVDGIVGEIGNYSNPNSPIKSNEIPGYFINGKTQAKHEQPARGELTSTRTFFVLVIVAEIPPNSPDGMEDAYEALEPFLDAIPLAFCADWALLAEDDKSLPGVAGITALIDDQPEEITREKKRYTAIPYRISVTFNRTL